MRIEGSVLRAWRRSRGWDTHALARRMRRGAGDDDPLPDHDILVRMLRRWEREGMNTARAERYALLYATVLGVRPDDLGAGPRTATASAAVAAVSGRDGDDPVDRREFGTAARPEPHGGGVPRRDFVALAAGVISLLDVLRASPDLPGRLSSVAAGHASVDAETAAGLAQVMGGYRRIYQSAGAASLLDPVCGTLSLLGELAPAAGAWRDLLVSLIGQASSLTATMLMLDRNDQAAAARYLAIAARAAQQAGDDELMAIIYAARAFHSAYGGDPLDGLAYARQAVSIASSSAIHPRTRGWVCAVESEMHATAGDEASFRRALGSAEDQLAGPMPDEPWKGIGAFSLAKLTAYRGGGLMRLGRYADAQAQLAAALGQLDPVQAKHRCTAHVDLAAAFAADRKPDQAAHHAMQALEIITTTGHANSLRRIGRVSAEIGPSGTPVGRDLASRYLEVKAASVG